MVRKRGDASKTSGGNHHHPPLSPPPSAMKGTVDESVLKKLYVQMLNLRMSSPARGQSAIAGKEAMLGSIVELAPGDAIAPLSEDTAVAGALESAPGLHLLPPHLGLATGVALACKLQNHSNVVVALGGARTLDSGSAHEALTYAAREKLPLIVVLDCGAGAPDAIDSRAAAYGIPSISVDGDDAVAVYRVSREAINRARAGRGPTLIACQASDAGIDPIAHIEHYLEKHGWWTPGWKRQLTKQRSS